MADEETDFEDSEVLAEFYRAIATRRFAGTSSAHLALSIAKVAVVTQMPPTPRGPQLRYRSVEEFVLREGLAFELKAPPRDVAMGQRHQCYANCYKRALAGRRYAYCEGMALGQPGFPPLGHAWLLDLTDGRLTCPRRSGPPVM